MAYVDGFVIPVPKLKLDAYKAQATRLRPGRKEHGALASVECIGDDVPDGTLTSVPACGAGRGRRNHHLFLDRL